MKSPSEMTDDELREELGVPPVGDPKGQAGAMAPFAGQGLNAAENTLQRVMGTTGEDLKTFGEFGLRSFLDDILNLPKLVGEGLAAGGAALQTLAGTPNKLPAQGTPPHMGQRFMSNLEQNRQQFPASGLINMPAPDTGDVLATGKALQGQSFDEARLLQGIRDEATRQVNPVATGLGDLAGDVATLATIKTPIARGRAARIGRERDREALDFLARKDAKRSRADPRVGARFDELPKEIKEKYDGFVTDKLIPALKFSKDELPKALPRGLGKIGEASLEAATLAVLNGDDPYARAGFAAGAQGVGSLALTVTDKIFLGRTGERASRLLLAFGAAYLTHDMIKAAGPGDQSFFESKDFAVQALVAGYALGGLAALTGAGRIGGVDYEKMPVVMDTLTQAGRTMHRGIFFELLEQKRADSVSWGVLQKMARDPEYFTFDQMNSLGRALTGGKSGAFTKEVERLMEESPSFREKADKL